MPDIFARALASLGSGYLGGQDTARQQTMQDAAVQATNARNGRLDAMKQLVDQATIGKLNADTTDLGAQQTLRQGQDEQNAYLHGPEFQTDFQAAQGGDQGALAKITGRLAGHPSAQSILQQIAPKAPKDPNLLTRNTTRGIEQSIDNGRTWTIQKDDAGKPVMPWAPPQTPTISIEQGTPGQPAQGVVTHGPGLGQTVPLPGVTKGPAGTGNAIQNRQKDYVSLMQNALPQMETLAPKVNPTNITMAVKYPAATNYVMSPEDRQYMISARDFLAGVLHEESGARLSDKQIEWGVPRYIVQGGDDPVTIQKKLANARAVATARAANIGYVPPGAPISDTARAQLEADMGAQKSPATANKTITVNGKTFQLP